VVDIPASPEAMRELEDRVAEDVEQVAEKVAEQAVLDI
jgi:hypothetical protein